MPWLTLIELAAGQKGAGKGESVPKQVEIVGLTGSAAPVMQNKVARQGMQHNAQRWFAVHQRRPAHGNSGRRTRRVLGAAFGRWGGWEG
jgi:hypothetical protein